MGLSVEDEPWMLADKLCEQRSLSAGEYERLIAGRTPRLAAELAGRACAVRSAVYGDAVFARGLIEFTNWCDNDCLYCGIRRSNGACERYRLSLDEVVACAEDGWSAGFRTFVLQGGQHAANDGFVAEAVRALKRACPDCAVTLSAGERPGAVYKQWREAGADRYLLRHETATPSHYRQLHPRSMTLDGRLACWGHLRRVGYAVGAGFMVGAPFQTPAHLAADLKLIEAFRPEMCGIGPFVPHRQTPFASFSAGTVELTCFLVSLIRIAHPTMLLPATTALEALAPDGRASALAAGANVVMPNLSPEGAQRNYRLYEGKPASGGTAAARWEALGRQVSSLGLRLVVDRGDPREALRAAASLNPALPKEPCHV